MVGYDPKKVNLTQKEQVYVSVSTSVLSRFLVQPFDVVKIRFQLQYEPISGKSTISKYKSLTQTFSTIVREEGLFALWKGHLTGQLLSVSYITTQFLWFEALTKATYLVWPNMFNNDRNKVVSHFFCGGLAASLTVLSSQPIDVVRTRLVSQGEPRVYRGIGDAFRSIYYQEGIRGFYRGTVPGLILTTPETAFRFAIYQFLNSNWHFVNDFLKSLASISEKKTLDEKEIGYLQSSVCGSLSGVLSKTIVYPFDVAKKRLQVQGFEKARENFGQVVRINGLMNCFYITVKKEGFLGLYKGYLPSMLKAAVSSGLIFFLYEQFSSIVRKMKKNKNF